jgi:hypothetical protein
MSELLITIISISTPGFAFLAYKHSDIAKKVLQYTLAAVAVIFIAYSWTVDSKIAGYQKSVDIVASKEKVLAGIIDTLAAHKDDISTLWKGSRYEIISFAQLKVSFLLSISRDIKDMADNERDEFRKYRNLLWVWLGLLTAIYLFAEIWEKHQLQKAKNKQPIDTATNEDG